MAEPAARTDVDALRLSIQRGFAGVPPDVIVALLAMLDELVSVREERDESLALVVEVMRERDEVGVALSAGAATDTQHLRDLAAGWRDVSRRNRYDKDRLLRDDDPGPHITAIQLEWAAREIDAGRAARQRAEDALRLIADSYPWDSYQDDETILPPMRRLEYRQYPMGLPTNRRIAREALKEAGAAE